MKKLLGSISILMFLAILGCKTAENKTEPKADINVNKPAQFKAYEGQRCYLLTEGNNNEDSTKIKINFNTNNKITGNMEWLPYEKDGAIGVITGRIKNDTISGYFNYMIEGSNQSEEIELKIVNNQLLQWNSELIENSDSDGGDPVLNFKDKSVGKWSSPFSTFDCNKLVFY